MAIVVVLDSGIQSEKEKNNLKNPFLHNSSNLSLLILAFIDSIYNCKNYQLQYIIQLVPIQLGIRVASVCEEFVQKLTHHVLVTARTVPVIENRLRGRPSQRNVFTFYNIKADMNLRKMTGGIPS
jgi:hypothetical protein